MSVTSTVVHRAETQFIQAAEMLRPYVGCFWVITAEQGATIRVVPDGSTAVSIQLPADPEWRLRGPLTEPQERRFASASTLIGVRLRAGVAFLLTGIRADAMLGRHIRLSGDGFHALASQTYLAKAPAEYVEVLQRFLIGRLSNAQIHPVVAGAVQAIERAAGCTGVGEVASSCGVSPRHLNRLMRAWVGYGPKRLVRIVRFQAALNQMERAPDRSGAALASETGYFDQAHLTQDMARLAGATPHHVASRCVADFYKTRCDHPL